MQLEVRPYQPEDYFEISRKEYDLLTFGTVGKPELISKQLCEGMAFTASCEKGLVACAGVLPVWKAVAEAWCIGSPLIQYFKFSFPKNVKKKLEEMINHYRLDRVQTVVDAEFIVSINWLERMGFTYEGPMEKYIAGRTFFRYAWIRR